MVVERSVGHISKGGLMRAGTWHRSMDEVGLAGRPFL